MERREDLEQFLKATDYLDANHPEVMAKARELIKDCKTEKEKLQRIYYFVREFPYDLQNSLRYLAQGKFRASDVLREGKAFCMGKASSFVALCRAAGIPARVGFQQLDCPDKPFFSQEMREMWGARKLPWHSLGEAYLDGKWLKLDATIDSEFAKATGRAYTQEFDGRHDIPTVEGPILKELGSYADYPPEVAQWYADMAREVVEALDARDAKTKLAKDDSMWAGPESKRVQQRATK